MTDPTRAVAYLRCSTNRQDLLPETKRVAACPWAERNDVAVVAWHFDKGVEPRHVRECDRFEARRALCEDPYVNESVVAHTIAPNHRSTPGSRSNDEQ